MTRKQAAVWQRDLKARGVYKPYVGADKEWIYIESYPLNAKISRTEECDPERGPFRRVKVTDCSLSRLGQDSTVVNLKLWMGQVPTQVIGGILIGLHAEAYARAQEQDAKVGQ